MPQSYVIKPGDTLTKIGQSYGMNWKDIWQANPNIKNPDLIFAGKTLTIPDSINSIKQPSGSLDKTLPPIESKKTVGNIDKTLPDTPAGTIPSASITVPKTELPAGNIDQMTLLKIMLGEASNLAVKQGTKSGLTTTFKSLSDQGVLPENASGNLTSRIIDFVEGRTSKPIENEFNKMSTIIDSMAKTKENLVAQQEKLKDDARQQISQAISSDMWNNMDDTQRKKLWDSAGYTGNPIASKNTNTSYYHVTDDNGDIWNVGYDKTTGAITSKDNLGPIGKQSTNSPESTDNKEIDAFLSDSATYIEKLDNGTLDWKTAWDALKTKYPKASNEAIDQALGGGHNPNTGEWWGRAK
ncbi:LysM peptidoglycan-binding domain-containing protein [bacterium]|jgi:LysM repeat protein|nr:LysM peptidoglycan-binding domain-containing protein [bacterium]